MAIQPSSKLKLLKCPLTLDNKNQLTFSNSQEQFNYFNSLPKLEVEEISYIRKDSSLYYPENIDKLLNYNYCMYQNANYGDKWFYGFITNMEYIADENTKMTIVTDVFQTWQFDITWKESFVEREMINSNDDIIGKNRIVEGLETGEYFIKKSYNIAELDHYYVIAYVGESIKVNELESISTPQRGFKYNGVYSSVCFIVCNENGFNYMMNLMPNSDNSNNILTIFTTPKLAFTIPETSNSWSTNGYYVINENIFSTPLYKQLDPLTSNSDFEGYVPRNKKLLQYPFTYIGFNPIKGDRKIFRFEDFYNNTPYFEIESEINPNPNICVIPHNYKKSLTQETNKCIEETCTISGFPNVSYKTDTFNTWLAQNQDIMSITMQQQSTNYQQQTIQNYFNTAQLGINTASSAMNNVSVENARKDTVQGLISASNIGVNQAFSEKNYQLNVNMLMAQVEKQKMIPDTATLSANSTILGYGLLNDGIFTHYTISREFAEKIDRYFDMYGYLTNTLKIPNLNNRPNWNFIKVTQANILANIPQTDLQTIKAMFEAGITLWHNKNTFLDYSQNNR
jgi:hypothetical protein